MSTPLLSKRLQRKLFGFSRRLNHFIGVRFERDPFFLTSLCEDWDELVLDAGEHLASNDAGALARFVKLGPMRQLLVSLGEPECRAEGALLLIQALLEGAQHSDHLREEEEEVGLAFVLSEHGSAECMTSLQTLIAFERLIGDRPAVREAMLDEKEVLFIG